MTELPKWLRRILMALCFLLAFWLPYWIASFIPWPENYNVITRQNWWVVPSMLSLVGMGVGFIIVGVCINWED